MCLINQQFKNKQNNAHIKDSKCVSLYFAAEQLNILVNISLLGSSARCVDRKTSNVQFRDVLKLFYVMIWNRKACNPHNYVSL